MVARFMLENSECGHREPVHVSSSSMYIALDGAEDLNIVIDKAYALTCRNTLYTPWHIRGLWWFGRRL